jgi:hypothetical protein
MDPLGCAPALDVGDFLVSKGQRWCPQRALGVLGAISRHSDWKRFRLLNAKEVVGGRAKHCHDTWMRWVAAPGTAMTHGCMVARARHDHDTWMAGWRRQA